MPEPLELATLRQIHLAEMQAFARAVDHLLAGAEQLLDEACLLDAVSARLTLQAMKQSVVDRFAQQLRQAAPCRDPLGLQPLVCDAYDLFFNPETRLNLKDWKRDAEPFVRS